MSSHAVNIALTAACELQGNICCASGATRLCTVSVTASLRAVVVVVSFLDSQTVKSTARLSPANLFGHMLLPSCSRLRFGQNEHSFNDLS